MSLSNDILAIKNIFEDKKLFKAASPANLDRRMDLIEPQKKAIRARRQADTWEQRKLDFEPGDIDPWFSCWFEDMGEEDQVENEMDPEYRNRYFGSFILDCLELCHIDLQDLQAKYLGLDEATRDESAFFAEAEDRLAKAGYYVYNSDTRIEVFQAEDLSEYDIEADLEESVDEAGFFKPAGETELANRADLLPKGEIWHRGRRMSANSNYGIVHRFINGATRGKSSTGNMSIEGDILYSYQTPIAIRKDNLIYYGDIRHSVTTSAKHQGPLRYMAGPRLRVIPGREFLELAKVTPGSHLGWLSNRAYEASMFKPASDANIAQRPEPQVPDYVRNAHCHNCGSDDLYWDDKHDTFECGKCLTVGDSTMLPGSPEPPVYEAENPLFKPAGEAELGNRPAPKPWPEKFVPYIGKRISIKCRDYCRPEEPLVGVVTHNPWPGYHSQLDLIVDGYGGKAKHLLDETDELVEVLDESEKPLFKPAGDAELDARGYTGVEYRIWIGSYFDGTMGDKDAALFTAKTLAKKNKDVKVYEVPVGFKGGWTGGKRIYPPQEAVAEAGLFKPAGEVELSNRRPHYNRGKFRFLNYIADPNPEARSWKLTGVGMDIDEENSDIWFDKDGDPEFTFFKNTKDIIDQYLSEDKELTADCQAHFETYDTGGWSDWIAKWVEANNGKVIGSGNTCNFDPSYYWGGIFEYTEFSGINGEDGVVIMMHRGGDYRGNYNYPVVYLGDFGEVLSALNINEPNQEAAYILGYDGDTDELVKDIKRYRNPPAGGDEGPRHQQIPGQMNWNLERGNNQAETFYEGRN